MTDLNQLYNSAVDAHGQEAADAAAQCGIEAFNVNAIAGASIEQCEAEQEAAFLAALDTAE